MNGRNIGRRRTRDVIEKVPPPRAGGDVAPADALRLVAEVADKVNETLGTDAAVFDVELVTGSNTIAHGLGRKPSLVTAVPKTAVAAFAFGWDPNQPGNPRPDALVTITAVGGPVTCRVVVG